MSRIFVSSLVRGFEEYRSAARDAVVRARWVPIMSEDQPAGGFAPRTTLLREIGRADALLLLLGGRYGDGPAPSPTEEEFREAERLGMPILVMVQEGVPREAGQQGFIERVSSGWSTGRYRGGFTTPDELKTAVILALTELDRDRAGGEGRRAAARERVIELTGRSTPSYGQAPQLRVVVVPADGGRIIRATDLNEGTLADGLAGLARAAGLVGALAGFEASVSAEGVEIVEGSDRFRGEQLRIRVERDGSLIVDGPIGGDGQMGAMWVDPVRVKTLVQQGLKLAPQVWALLGAGDVVIAAFVQVAVPGAGQRSWGRPAGTRFSLGGVARLDGIWAPADPELVTARALAAGQPAAEISAEIERAYRDAGAVNE